MRILATLLRPDAGGARVAGFDVVAAARARCAAAISLTGQYAAVDELQTGEENLRMMGRLAGLSAPGAAPARDELLERFDLVDGGRAAGRRPTRAACAGGWTSPRASSAAPRCIFLDEPTTGLDPRSRQAMWDVVTELVRSGVTVFLTTQYLEEADRLADRIAVIDGGRVVAEGTPAELKRRVADQRLDLVLRRRRGVRGAPPRARRPGVAATRRSRTLGVATDGGAADVRALLDELDPEPPPSSASRSTARRSTTSSCPSPAIRPRPTRDRRRPPSRRPLRCLTRADHGRAAACACRCATSTRCITSLMLPVMLMLMFVYLFGGAIHTGDGLRHLRRPGRAPAVRGLRRGDDRGQRRHDMASGIVDRLRSMDVRGAARARRARGGQRRAQRRLDVARARRRVRASASARTPTSLDWLAVGRHPARVRARDLVAGRGDRPARAVARGRQRVTFFVMFLPYASSAFVPVDTMPSWLQGFAAHQPVTPVDRDPARAAARHAGRRDPATALAWCGGILVVSVALSGVLFGRRTA